MGHSLTQSDTTPTSYRLRRLLTDPASRYLLRQRLVTISLSYEFLLGGESVISPVISHGLAMGLWLAISIITMLPQALLGATWLSVGPVTIDTFLGTVIIYLS